MPAYKVTVEKLAVMRAMRAANATHSQIARVIGVTRDAVSWNLAGKRKSEMPRDEMTIAQLLRKAADALESGGNLLKK